MADARRASQSEFSKGFVMRTTDMVQVKQAITTFSEWLLPEQEQMFRDHLARFRPFAPVGASTLDVLTLGVRSWRAALDLAERTCRSGFPMPEYTLGFMLGLIPDEVDNVTYGLALTDNMEWFFKWLEMPLVEDYSVWESEGENHGVPADEWERRAATWERVHPSKSDPLQGLFVVHPMFEGAPLSDDFLRRIYQEMTVIVPEAGGAA